MKKACYDQQADILELLLDPGGSPIEWRLLDQAKYVLRTSKDPEMKRVLSESRVLEVARNSISPKRLEDETPAPAFDEGGRLPVKY